MDNIQELREAVNPVFNTAKSCVQLLAAAGDEDSQRLINALGFGSFGTQVSARKSWISLKRQASLPYSDFKKEKLCFYILF